jgi:hypothetical protein
MREERVTEVTAGPRTKRRSAREENGAAERKIGHRITIVEMSTMVTAR